MMPTSPHTAQTSSRLICLLNDIAPSPVAINEADMPEQLAQLFDFSSSVSLSKAYGKLATTPFQPGTENSASLRNQFLAVRASLVRSVIVSFDTNSESSRFTLPERIDPNSVADASAGEPYQKFYIAHQRQFDLSIQNLRAQVRKGAAGLSPELAQLAALDAMLGTTVTSHARKCYAAIPKLLHQHFAQLHREYQTAQQGQQSPADFIEPFCQQMRDILLAEIEDRLLPVLGLIEAINHKKY